MEEVTTIVRTIQIYHNCNLCPSFQKPDADGKIFIRGRDKDDCTLTLTEIYTPEGMKPNPCKGYCNLLSIRVNDTEFPVRKNDTKGFPEMTSLYHTPDGKCIAEHNID
jgi:hypothetical protein